MNITVSAYKFTRLEGLQEWREVLRARCVERGLRGTILLSEEGINLFVSGERKEVEGLLAEVRQREGLEDLEAKVSECGERPFNRMLVKIKREIIAFGVEGVDPVGRPTRKLSPGELKAWLDEGRRVRLLDTRNDYEVKMGTFRGAVELGVKHFRDFPEAAKRLPAEWKEEPVVTFCTGGIRCEKAGPFLEREGFREVYQLDGGILKYFEMCGGAHYDGECFVFDRRVGVDAALRETGAVLCWVCQMPLSEAEQADARYQVEVSCPHCHGRRR